jgi:hypothetical protein
MTNSQERQIRELVHEIEHIRLERRAKFTEITHRDGKRFTQEELREAVPVFKNLHLGRTRRLPNRETILQIADYLECSYTELNNLLLIAQYLPEINNFDPAQHRAALEQARFILHSLLFPAAIVSPGWHEEDHNQASILLDGAVTEICMTNPGVLPWYFDPELTRITRHAPNNKAVRSNARTLAHFFRHIHQFSQNQEWFRNLVGRYNLFPDFNEAWQQSKNDNSPLLNWQVTLQLPNGSLQHNEQLIVIPVGVNPFPLIVAQLPVDEAAYHYYQSLGINLTENRWQQSIQRAN